MRVRRQRLDAGQRALADPGEPEHRELIVERRAVLAEHADRRGCDVARRRPDHRSDRGERHRALEIVRVHVMAAAQLVELGDPVGRVVGALAREQRTQLGDHGPGGGGPVMRAFIGGEPHALVGFLGAALRLLMIDVGLDVRCEHDVRAPDREAIQLRRERRDPRARRAPRIMAKPDRLGRGAFDRRHHAELGLDHVEAIERLEPRIGGAPLGERGRLAHQIRRAGERFDRRRRTDRVPARARREPGEHGRPRDHGGRRAAHAGFPVPVSA